MILRIFILSFYFALRWRAIKEIGQVALGLRPLQRVQRLQGLLLVKTQNFLRPDHLKKTRGGFFKTFNS